MRPKARAPLRTRHCVGVSIVSASSFEKPKEIDATPKEELVLKDCLGSCSVEGKWIAGRWRGHCGSGLGRKILLAPPAPCGRESVALGGELPAPRLGGWISRRADGSFCSLPRELFLAGRGRPAPAIFAFPLYRRAPGVRKCKFFCARKSPARVF